MGSPTESTAERLLVRQVKATPEYISVDCEQTRKGRLEVSVPLKSGEHVLQVVAGVEGTDNLKRYAAAVVSFGEGGATIQYSLTGLDRNVGGLNCPGGGHGDVVANFVVASGN